MTAPDSVDPAGWLDDHLAGASPDLRRNMVKTFADALMSAEADQRCGAEYGTRSPERVTHPRWPHQRIPIHGLTCKDDFPSGTTLGKYYASHAERQANYLHPHLPVRVDKPMCQDCQDYFAALAQHSGRS